ncbi:hypothetical protein [Aeropyrum globular virus 1]|uniref:hypothetical protein n=1 Tax=Aeropyrum globular virus 1 TaxID=1932713 RepID=UPI000C7F3744|nr:hypothetical protein C1186_gp22 [Aeropyrum globular virus 1]BBC20948.1 hypothetical protein [Aeropyrum globular virus 1]
MARGVEYLRYITPMTLDEESAYQLLFARAMNHLNGRRFLGVKRLVRAKRRCEGVQSVMEPYRYFSRCDRQAEIALLFQYNYKYYAVYLCRECYVKTVEAVKKYLQDRVSSIAESLLEMAGDEG